jgi:23S rRNA pseudouridine955/2504/2580 synthase
MLALYCDEGRLIHRLDRKTSGLMALAKNKDMAGFLTSLFKEREIYKAYYALLCGIPRLPSGIIR